MMTAGRPDSWCCRIVELAAHTLPPQSRQRYAMEFIAELYDQPRSWQFQHAFSVLIHSWQLRAALAETDTLGDVMTANTQPRRSLRCRLGVHDWQLERNPESGATFKTCARCGKDNTDNHGLQGGFGLG